MKRKILLCLLFLSLALAGCSKDSVADNFKEYIKSTSDTTEAGKIYYNIYLESSLNWEDIGYPEQSDFAKACVLYCEGLAAKSNTSYTNVNVMAYKSDGSTAFSTNGSSVIRLYSDGMYDCDYNIIR